MTRMNRAHVLHKVPSGVFPSLPKSWQWALPAPSSPFSILYLSFLAIPDSCTNWQPGSTFEMLHRDFSSVHGRMGSLAWVKETKMSFPERSELSMAVTCFTVQLGGTSFRRPPMDNRACGHIMHSNDCFSEKAGLTFNWCKYGFQIPSRSSCRYFLVKYPR